MLDNFKVPLFNFSQLTAIPMDIYMTRWDAQIFHCVVELEIEKFWRWISMPWASFLNSNVEDISQLFYIILQLHFCMRSQCFFRPVLIIQYRTVFTFLGVLFHGQLPSHDMPYMPSIYSQFLHWSSKKSKKNIVVSTTVVNVLESLKLNSGKS